ncbi:MAG: hypothetical protein GTO16_08835 [Candidatus Aminicenantes bacterium]|nr:hypothetical protein [Candidatus Aminicenantes bacterium]
MKKSKKFTALFLISSLLTLSANLNARERRGAEHIITKKDGQQIKGELITVKPNSLLLLNTEGRDVSVAVDDIRIIRIVKKSKFVQSLGIGLLIGAATGAILGLAEGESIDFFGGTVTAGENALIGGALVGFNGLIIGGISGLASGKDKTIQLEGRSQEELKLDLKKLRKKARIRDYK